MNEDEHLLISNEAEIGADWEFHKISSSLIQSSCLPFAEYFTGLIYYIYTSLTLVNASIFLLKYVPTAYYLYKFIKDMYLTSRDRIKRKQMEAEEIKVQIQILNKKLCVRDADFKKRGELLRRGVEHLQRIRAHVRYVIASDEALCRSVPSRAWQLDSELPPTDDYTAEDREFIVELLKELNYARFRLPESSSVGQQERTECNGQDLDPTPDGERQDCRVKVVKVTNMYKVAYLKHYIKQKRLRRASKQALLKKKMENIKKLLEDWQKTLNMVINSKLVLKIAHPMDVTSQDAMGDYSKSRDVSDTDSDLRNSSTDVCYDEYNHNWTQNTYKPYPDNIEDELNREYSESLDFEDKFSALNSYPCTLDQSKANMCSIIEETNSEIAITQIKTEDDDDCRDLIAL